MLILLMLSTMVLLLRIDNNLPGDIIRLLLGRNLDLRVKTVTMLLFSRLSFLLNRGIISHILLMMLCGRAAFLGVGDHG